MQWGMIRAPMRDPEPAPALPSEPIKVKRQVACKALGWVTFQAVPGEPPAWGKRRKTPDKHLRHFIDSLPCSSSGGENKMPSQGC